MSNGLRVVKFVSRNKDNRDVDGFKKRSETFLSDKNDAELISLFQRFLAEGLDGEFCRLYVSINNRDNEAIRNNLLHYLIDHPDADMSRIGIKAASLAARAECRADRKWLFDFDAGDLEEFVKDVYECDPTVELRSYPTPNGLAVVASHGFDVRNLDLDNKWKHVELKKDAMRCLFWDTSVGAPEEEIEYHGVVFV